MYPDSRTPVSVYAFSPIMHTLSQNLYITPESIGVNRLNARSGHILNSLIYIVLIGLCGYYTYYTMT